MLLVAISSSLLSLAMHLNKAEFKSNNVGQSEDIDQFACSLKAELSRTLDALALKK